jgi:6-phosphofructokinase 1
VSTRKIMDIGKLIDVIVKVMLAREAEGKDFGVIVIAEGLAQFLPASYLEGVKFDEHGHISLAQTNLARTMVKAVDEEYKRRTGKAKRITGLQLGYEARCALPHAFDVILGSQLGVGAYRALVENHLDGVLISCSGQLNLSYVPFSTLVDPETLVTVVRFIQSGSDFHRLARFLENYPHD